MEDRASRSSGELEHRCQGPRGGFFDGQSSSRIISGLEVVAEGVETEAIAEQLLSLGCDIVQGYLYSPPLVAEALAYWVRERARSLPVIDSDIIPIRPLTTVSSRRPGVS